MKQLLTFLLIPLFFIACSNGKTHSKTLPGDPFAATIVPSEFNEIDAGTDNIISGSKGTVVLIPKGSLMLNGKTYTGKAKIELAEALDKEDMLLSNLTTTSDGKPLESGGMIYLNAYAGGHELSVNPDKPIQVQVPAAEKKAGMLLYKGERDAKGNINWIEPKPITNTLTAVALKDLDFLPEGFAKAVANGMPYKDHRKADARLTDSLYYALAIRGTQGPVLQPAPGQSAIDMNEAWYNSREIKKGEYTEDAYNVRIAGQVVTDDIIAESHAQKENCGIDPARIKVLKDPKFENTLIATREFEARLKVLFRICRNDLLELYINNLDKELWVVDDMVLNQIGKAHTEYKSFENFAAQKLGKVRGSEQYAELLKDFFSKRLEKVKAELQQAEDKLRKAIAKQDAAAEKMKSEYRDLLWKREKHRMQAYELEWTEMGWANIDKPKPGEPAVSIEKCPPKSIEVTLENSNEFDRSYVYVVFTEIESIFRMNTSDRHVFFTGGENTERYMEMQCEPEVRLVCIAYKGQELFMAEKLLKVTEPKMIISFKAKPASKEILKDLFRDQKGYKEENQISRDLEFQEKIDKENKRQQVLCNEELFMQRLWDIANPCCAEKPDGMALFNANCASCHSINHKSTGPPLYDVIQKHSRCWLVAFTRNNEKLRAQGDAEAIAVYEENGKVAMTVFENLTDREIGSIYDWIDGQKTP